MWIEDETYRIILEKMPIPTVDGIVLHEGQYLLLKRNNVPAKGQWWLPGGRVRKGESLEQAVKREVFEETGLKCGVLSQVGVTNMIFPECHTISIYFLMESEGRDVKMNDEHSEYRWVSTLPEDSHDYLRGMIRKARLST